MYFKTQAAREYLNFLDFSWVHCELDEKNAFIVSNIYNPRIHIWGAYTWQK